MDRIAQAYNDLRRWAEDMERSRKFAAEYCPSPEFTDFIVHGQVPWPITGIVQALKDAAAARTSEGWTPVDAAAQWIAENYLDERPDGYGCTNWQQVIHECKMFELRYLFSGGARRAVYRLRDPNPSKSD